MKTLVCPHCDAIVSERAQVCDGCGAEVVHGATRRERMMGGFIFAAVAFIAASVVWRALELHNGSPLIRPSAEGALPFFLGLFAVLAMGYFVGKGIAAAIRRSHVRFFRSYRHQ